MRTIFSTKVSLFLAMVLLLSIHQKNRNQCQFNLKKIIADQEQGTYVEYSRTINLIIGQVAFMKTVQGIFEKCSSVLKCR